MAFSPFNSKYISIVYVVTFQHVIEIWCYFSLILDRRLIMTDAAKSFDSNSSSTTLKETRIDNRIECNSSLPSKKFHKMALQRQDSIDHTQNISNNNQDVSIFLIGISFFC